MKNNSYDDIINLPHPVSKNHPQMPLRDRAAQFAPFAALTGLPFRIFDYSLIIPENNAIQIILLFHII